MWFDDITKLIRIRTLREVSAAADVFDDSVIISSSYNAKDQPGKRVSQVWTYYGLKNPLEGVDDAKNYRSAVATVDPDGLTDYGEESIRTIFSRWIPAFGRSAAATLNDLILSRYASPPRSFGFRLMRSEGGVEPSPGGGYRLSTLMLQGPTGEPAVVSFQATSVKVDDVFITVTGEEVLYSQTISPPDPDVRNITIDTNATNINIRTVYDTIYTAPDALTVVNVFIEAGVVVGSSSEYLPALQCGSWPAGVTLNVSNSGRIQGKGGEGGRGASVYWSPGAGVFVCSNGLAGVAGGDAFKVDYDVNLTNNGEIWAGGGGGGGGGSHYSLTIGSATNSGGGGGGGAGTLSSLGGTPGNASGGTISNKLGETGAGGTSEAGGAGGLSGSNVEAYRAGAGGGPATAGATGGTIVSAQSSAAGGAGGAAGRAIVQSGGVASIITTGDILGAII